MNLRAKVFSFYLLFALGSGLIVQLILPSFFPEPCQNGLIKFLGDSVTFHQIGLDISKQLIGTHYSFSWSPHLQMPGVILGFIYAVTGIASPLWQVPINSFLLGLNAIVILRIFPQIQKRYILLFLILCTPTSMGWITQVSKDIYIGLGISCIFVGIYELIVIRKIRSFLLVNLGFFIVFIFKSHWFEVLLAGLPIVFICCFVVKSLRTRKNVVMAVATTLILFVGMKAGRVFYQNISSNQSVSADPTKSVAVGPNLNNVNFEYHELLPYIDKILIKLGYAHFRFSYMFSHASEKYYPDWKMNSASAVLSYVPYAFFLGTFDPLPWKMRWSEGLSKGALFSLLQVEMLFFYVSFFILILYFNRQSSEFKAFIVGWFLFVSLFVIVFGFVSPNMGAINRYRFPFILTLKVLAVISFYNGRKYE
jgi:hypothetical protein